jgi:hypothetical protein
MHFVANTSVAMIQQFQKNTVAGSGGRAAREAEAESQIIHLSGLHPWIRQNKIVVIFVKCASCIRAAECCITWSLAQFFLHSFAHSCFGETKRTVAAKPVFHPSPCAVI